MDQPGTSQFRVLLHIGHVPVKNPVQEHGASSMEKAIYFGGLIANGRRWSANGRRWSANGRRWSANGRRWSANGRRWSANGRRWSAPKPPWPFIPARKSGPFWLFHVSGLFVVRKLPGL